MAPPDLGSQSEDSQPESGPLEYIELSLRTLEQNTLKIKKRNDEIIKTISDRAQNSVSSSYRGWKGSPIDVPAPPSTIPKKPQRNQSRALLNVDVEKILAESSKLKEKIHETLRQSEKTREENKIYMDNLRKESLQLSSLPPIGSFVPTTTSGTVGLELSHTMSHHHKGIFSSIQTAFKKLGGDGINSSKNKEKVAYHSLLAPVTEVASDQRVHIQLFPVSLEETDSQPLQLRPPIKPRVKRASPPIPQTNGIDPRPCPRIRRSQMPPPPKPPHIILQLEDFKKMYEYQSVTSDDETTLSHSTPIPKPRGTLKSYQSSESSSESEFEYISAPLVIETVSLLESDESLPLTAEATIPIDEPKNDQPVKPARFLKNSQSTIPVPKHYMKQKVAEERAEKIQTEFLIPQPPLQKTSTKKIRIASPPPPSMQKIPRKISSGRSETLYGLSEADSGMTTNSMEDLAIVDLPHSEMASRTSALQLGVTVEPIEVPVRPWVEEESATNLIILASPFHFPETDSNKEDLELASDEASNFNAIVEIPQMHSINEPVLNMDQKIQDEFSFLDEVYGADNWLDSIFPENTVIDDEAEKADPVSFEKTCRYICMVDKVSEPLFEITANIASPPRIYSKFETTEEFSITEESSDSVDQSIEPIVTPNLSPIQASLPFDCSSVQDPSETLPLNPAPPSIPPPPPPMQPLIEEIRDTSFSTLPVLPLDERRFKGSVFHTIHALEPLHLQLDQNFIQENFLIIESPENENRRLSLACRRNQPQTDNAEPMNLLSLKLKQAIEIGSRSIKPDNYNTIVDAVKTINPLNMETDDVQVLLQMIPKENEKDTFAKFDENQCSKLPEGYKIMKALVKIPRLKKKLNSINFLRNFPDAIKCIDLRTQTLQTAIYSVQNSENFVKILQVVLAVVNQFGKEIKGFQIQSLERLARKKSCKSGVPLLNYIVKQVSESMPEAVRFYEDFQCIEEATKISLPEVRKVLKELEDEITIIKVEILATQQDSVDEDVKISSSLKNAQSNIENIHAELQSKSEIWTNTVQRLKELVEFFGMFNTQEEVLLDFFHTIQHFVTDFKQAVLSNEKLLAPTSEPGMSTGADAAVKSFTRKKSLPLSSKDAGSESIDKKIKRRQSFGPNSCQIKQNLGDESGQPEDFVNAITDLVTPRSPPGVGKNKEEISDGKNRQRKLTRKSHNFTGVIPRERERQ